MSLANEEMDEESISPRARNKFYLRLALALALVGSSFAATITLNAGLRTEFGQGVYQATACDLRIQTSYTAGSSSDFELDGSGADYIKELRVAGLDVSRCAGKKITFKIFKTGENSPSPVFLRRLSYSCTTSDTTTVYSWSAYGGPNACDGSLNTTTGAFNIGKEWLSFTSNRIHTLNVDLGRSESVTAIGVYGRSDDSTQNWRRLWVVRMCPATTGIPGASCNQGTNINSRSYLYDWTNFAGSTDNARYPQRFGPYYPSITSRYWIIEADDWGASSGLSTSSYYCGVNYSCSQVSEIELFASSDKIVLDIDSGGNVRVQNVDSGNGNLSALTTCSSYPGSQVNVCLDNGTYRIRFQYPYLKVADANLLTVETSS